MTKIIVKRIKGKKLISKNKRYLKKFDDMTVLEIFKQTFYDDFNGFYEVRVILNGKTKKIKIEGMYDKQADFKGREFKLIEFSEVKRLKEEIIKKPETKEELPEKLTLFERVKRFIGF